MGVFWDFWYEQCGPKGLGHPPQASEGRQEQRRAMRRAAHRHCRTRFSRRRRDHTTTRSWLAHKLTESLRALLVQRVGVLGLAGAGLFWWWGKGRREGVRGQSAAAARAETACARPAPPRREAARAPGRPTPPNRFYKPSWPRPGRRRPSCLCRAPVWLGERGGEAARERAIGRVPASRRRGQCGHLDGPPAALRSPGRVLAAELRGQVWTHHVS